MSDEEIDDYINDGEFNPMLEMEIANDNEEDEDMDLDQFEEDIDTEGTRINLNDAGKIDFDVLDSRRDKIKLHRSFQQIPPEKRRFRNRLSRFEYSAILSWRTEQIANGSAPLINVPDDIVDTRQIAEMEILQKKTPVIIARKDLDAMIVEYWKLSELEIDVQLSRN